MTRRIGYWVPRASHLRTIAPVIDYMLQAGGFEIVVIRPGWPIGKAALEPETDPVPALFGDRVTVVTVPAPGLFADIVLNRAIEAVVTFNAEVVDLPDADQARRRTRTRGVRWVSLPYVYHQDLLCATQPDTMARDWDLITTLGPRSIELIDARLGGVAADVRRRLLDRLAIVGYPELDGLARIDEAAVRAKYGLPPARPIVYVSTANTFRSHGTGGWTGRAYEARFRGRDTFSVRAALGMPATLRHPHIVPYRDYLGALRRLADRNGALLVAKTRGKHHDPDYLADAVDAVVGDAEFYPFTTLELMSVSSVYFGFLSMSALEALACGLYAITAYFVPLQHVVAPVFAEWSWLHLTAPGSVGNTEGASEIIDGTTAAGRRRLATLATSDLADLRGRPAVREALLDRVIAFRGKSCAAFVDALSGVW